MLERVNRLEDKIEELNRNIEDRDCKIKEWESRFESMVKEKDDIIYEKDEKLEYMSQEFESMLHDTLDRMTRKLEHVSMRWKEDVDLTETNQRKLARDFNFARLKI
ncbi:hypothetical protein O9G_000511 [Rozella allomycis CSF55]|uniref:Dynein regulatory complex protein 12 n=1 Tax=Rozella allomycis (strain CSF55) TaxID=988480 RepID=A0A075B0J5_ROZAC|nr:hypothetical protein O9G_000511 [Rozella allomycis CSF55]|eukprot:EPZ34324.1 hypothetical protein O9G_000511 [Rozella allomycis CSF55]